MKLTHFLSRILPVLGIAAYSLTVAQAAILHPNLSRVTYHDFGQNNGRYSVNNLNELLLDLTAEGADIELDSAGGIYISYTGENIPNWKLPQQMINFDSVMDSGQGGGSGAVRHAVIFTAAHVGTLNPTFTVRSLGEAHAIRYKGMEIRYSNTFVAKPENDYKFTRLNKIVTDVVTPDIYTGPVTTDDWLYRAGSGYTGYSNLNGNYDPMSGYGVTGAVQKPTMANAKQFNFYIAKWTPDQISADKTPMPVSGLPGDSGSPVYIWNEATGAYEFMGQMTAVDSYTNSRLTVSHSNQQWAVDKLKSFDVNINTGDNPTIHLGAITQAGNPITDNLGNTTTVYTGNILDADGAVMDTIAGVQSGKHTWNSLSGLKNNAQWYAYDSGYMNSALTVQDLFKTENLVLEAGTAASVNVELDANVDLGIGYVEFRAGEREKAEFHLRSAGNHQLDSAGYVIGDKVDVHVHLTNTDANYMREWRKTGAGNLYLHSSGNNEIFLNLGGSGTTYLQATDGHYAAWNVLVNTGAKVVINDINQIYRDLTFGNGGGTLDMNGHSMTWNNDNTPDADGFTIHALTQDAIIQNSKSSSVLTFTQSGAQTFSGSFKDAADSSLKVVYDGGGTWTLKSIHTHLAQPGSGLEVKTGTVELIGMNTVHGMGSVANSRYSHTDDWHYSDAEMYVTVRNGATFRLGSHARLTGDVTVQDGGTYEMSEGVKHRYEYIEGWYTKEDTYAIADYYGHKGNVQLEGDSLLRVQYSDGVTANTTYSGNISGTGNMEVNAGAASITLTGENTFSGTKTINSGTVEAAANKSLGDVTTHKWVVNDRGVLSSRDFTAANSGSILHYVDESSTGVLALQGTEVFSNALNLNGHQNLIIGAMEGQTVHYGSTGTTEILTAYNNEWNLGGGGGTLVVNFALQDGESVLNLGNEHTRGTVELTNTGNEIKQINFKGAVTLAFSDQKALGNAALNMNYGVRVHSHEDVSGMLSQSVTNNASGVLLLDKAQNVSSIDLTNHQQLSLGADKDTTFSGSIRVAENATYYFGGTTGTLTLTQALTKNGNNALVIDGQGHSGGRLVLGASSDITGKVTVMGYDSSRISNQGNSVTTELAFGSNNALASASGVELKNGGFIDLNGTTQRLNNLTVAAGSSVYDSVNGGSNTLMVNLSSSAAMNGTINVAQLEKTGNGQWTINGHLEYDTFRVSQGTVWLNVENALSASGTTYIESGATVKLKTPATVQQLLQGIRSVNSEANFHINGGTLDVSSVTDGPTLTGDITMNGDGGRLNLTRATHTGKLTFMNGTAEGGSVVSLASTSSNKSGTPIAVNLQSAITVLSGVGYIDTASSSVNSTVNVTGSIDINTGATLAFRQNTSGKSTNFTFRQANINTGTYSVSGSDGTVTTHSGGTLDMQNAHMQLTGTNQRIGGTLQLHHTTLTATANTKEIDNLSIADGATAHLNGNASWLIHSLNGNGTALSINTTGSATIDSAGNFSGTLTKTGGTLNLAHGQALQQADLVTNGGASVRLGAEQTVLNSLQGSATDSIQAAEGSALPHTLVLNGSRNAEFAGTVQGGLSLVKNGTSSQSFTGEATLQNVTANSGKLSLAQADIQGDVSISQGAELELGRAYELGTGKTLSVTASGDSLASARLNGELIVNGGTLVIDGTALQNATAGALTTGTVTMGENATLSISLGSLSNVDFGKAYTISSGDWSGLGEITTTGLQYMTYDYGRTATGLTITFNAMEGAEVWKGTEAAHVWSSKEFGNSNIPSSVAIFNDTASHREINLTATPAVDKIYFDNSEGHDYTLRSDNGSYLTGLSELTKSGEGKVSIGATIFSPTTALKLYGGTMELNASSFLGSIQACGDAGIVNNTHIITNALEATRGATLHLTGGDLNFTGLDLNTQGGTIELNNTGLVTTEQHSLHGTLSFAGQNTWNGSEKTASLAKGARILLTDGAHVQRTDNGLTTLNGSLETAEGATATFRTNGALQLTDGGQVLAGSGSHLDLHLGSGSSATASSAIVLRENARLSLTGNPDGGALQMGTNSRLNINNSLTVDSLALNNGSTISGSHTLTTGMLSLTGGSSTRFDSVLLKVNEGAGFDQRRLGGFTGTTSIELANEAVVDDRNSYYAVTGTLNINGGTANGGTLYINGIRMTDGGGTASALNVGAGAHLVITGKGKMTTNNASGAGSFSLSHWNAASSVNICGTLTSNAVISSWDSRNAAINVRDGGTLNLLDGLARHEQSGHLFKVPVNVQSGGTLNAAGGTQANYLEVNLLAGSTLGAVARTQGEAVHFSNSLNLGTANTAGDVTINTNVHTVKDFHLTEGNGGDVILSGATTFKSPTTLALAGTGSLHYSDGEMTQGMSIRSAGDKQARLGNVSELSRTGSAVTLSGGEAARATISGALVQLKGNSNLVLNDVHIHSDSAIRGTSGSGASITLNAVTANLSAANLIQEHTDGTLSLTSDMFAHTTLLGSDFTVNMEEDLVQKIMDGHYNALEITFTDTEFGETDMTLCASFSGYEVSPVTGALAGNVLTFSLTGIALSADNLPDSSTPVLQTTYLTSVEYAGGISPVFGSNMQAVPEPATATLSLLALTVLTARRRRRQ